MSMHACISAVCPARVQVEDAQAQLQAAGHALAAGVQLLLLLARCVLCRASSAHGHGSPHRSSTSNAHPVRCNCAINRYRFGLSEIGRAHV